MIDLAELERLAKVAVADNMEWKRLLQNLEPTAILALIARVRDLEEAVRTAEQEDHSASYLADRLRCPFCKTSWVPEAFERENHKSDCIVLTLSKES